MIDSYFNILKSSNIFLQALSVATNAENRSKNGTDSIVPYDRNRVILTPDGTRPHSTYINASFIEGYHNDESFIITQVIYMILAATPLEASMGTLGMRV